METSEVVEGLDPAMNRIGQQQVTLIRMVEREMGTLPDAMQSTNPNQCMNMSREANQRLRANRKSCA